MSNMLEFCYRYAKSNYNATITKSIFVDKFMISYICTRWTFPHVTFGTVSRNVLLKGLYKNGAGGFIVSYINDILNRFYMYSNFTNLIYNTQNKYNNRKKLLQDR